MAKPIIEVKDLSKVYQIAHARPTDHTSGKDVIKSAKNQSRFLPGPRRGKEEFWALKNVSFDVNQGQVLGIIGKNGAGKSTLLKILSRITNPTSGQAILRGRMASLLEVGTGFHPELTGRENVYLNGTFLGMSRQEISRKFDEIVDFAEVEKFLDIPVKFYSSGMYVRLAFAVAAHLDPEILIVDEVLAVGDAAFQKKSLGKMSAAAKEGRTVLFVSHNMEAIEGLCSKCLYLDEGQVKSLSSNVHSVVEKYLFDAGMKPSFSVSNEWTNDIGIRTDYFVPRKFLLADEKNEKLKMPVNNNSDIWLRVDGEILKTDPALNIGYALYSVDGQLLYWSNTTDESQDKWPSLGKGQISLKTRIPKRFLNSGSYRLELTASLHYRQWLLQPGVNSPSINFEIAGGLSDSPYMMIKRPGLLAPVLPWEIIK